MSYINFKPEVWSAQLFLDRNEKTVGVQNCWRLFDGQISRIGDTVEIEGLSGATVKDLPSTGIIDDPEDIESEEYTLDIDQKKYINFKVSDIDNIQSNGEEITAIISKTANNLATIQDQYVYNLAATSASKIIDATTDTTKLSSSNILTYLSNALAYIRSSKVYDNSEIFFEVHPYVFAKLELAFASIGQSGDTTLKNGYRGPLFGCQIYESNSILVTDELGNEIDAGTDGAIYNNIIRTGEAIAFAEEKSIDFKAYDVEKGFGEGVKGYTLYGAKVIKPNELVCLKTIISDD